MPSTDIAEALHQHGYAVVRGFLGEGDIPDGLLRFLEGAEKFHDGVIGDLPAADMQRIQARIAATVPAVAAAMGLAIAADRFGYCAIRIRESHAAPSLRLPFDQHRDPKTAPGGALNWHLDHFSYFLHGDHRNYLICYMPVFKPDAGLANVAIVADDVVARLDPRLHERIQGPRRAALPLRGGRHAGLVPAAFSRAGHRHRRLVCDRGPARRQSRLEDRLRPRSAQGGAAACGRRPADHACRRHPPHPTTPAATASRCAATRCPRMRRGWTRCAACSASPCATRS